jgi:hypothetical protein
MPASPITGRREKKLGDIWHEYCTLADYEKEESSAREKKEKQIKLSLGPPPN